MRARGVKQDGDGAGKMLARKRGNGKATKGGGGGRRGGLGNEMLCFFHLWREISRSPSGSLYTPHLHTDHTGMWMGTPFHNLLMSSLYHLFIYSLAVGLGLGLELEESPLPQSTMQCNAPLSLSVCDLPAWVVDSFESRALFRYPQNSKFFHSLSITSIFSRLHGALNVGKKITNCTV